MGKELRGALFSLEGTWRLSTSPGVLRISECGMWANGVDDRNKNSLSFLRGLEIVYTISSPLKKLREFLFLSSTPLAHIPHSDILNTPGLVERRHVPSKENNAPLSSLPKAYGLQIILKDKFIL